eukprot:scaffold2534_cov260-Pinguiococcus_pyrenoidosus.AAC.17
MLHRVSQALPGRHVLHDVLPIGQMLCETPVGVLHEEAHQLGRSAGDDSLDHRGIASLLRARYDGIRGPPAIANAQSRKVTQKWKMTKTIRGALRHSARLSVSHPNCGTKPSAADSTSFRISSSPLLETLSDASPAAVASALRLCPQLTPSCFSAALRCRVTWRERLLPSTQTRRASRRSILTSRKSAARRLLRCCQAQEAQNGWLRKLKRSPLGFAATAVTEWKG